MLRVCIASTQNVERSLLLLVVSASDIPLRTIKLFSVIFSSAYSSMLQAVTNKHSLVCRRLCALHCMVVGNCFCHFARPAIFDSQLLHQNRDLCLLRLHSTSPLGGGEFPSEYRYLVWHGKTRIAWLPDGEKICEGIFIRFDTTHERDRHTDRQTDRHRMTA